MDTELVLVRTARDRLERDPEASLRLLARHRRDYPNGLFAQEREVLAMEAELKLHRVDHALSRAARFGDRYPTSPHAHRVQLLLSRGRHIPRTRRELSQAAAPR